MKLLNRCLPSPAACDEVRPMSRIHDHLIALTAAAAAANGRVRVVNNNNANNNTRIDGWAGV